MAIKVDIRAVKDTIGADLRRVMRAAKNTRPALEAAGQVVVEQAKRAFRNPQFRPSEWAPLKPETLKQKAKKGQSSSILIAEAHMIRTPRRLFADNRRVIVGSNSPYARFHQMGEGDMYRPFWPFDKEGHMMPDTQRLVRWTLARRLGVTKK